LKQQQALNGWLGLHRKIGKGTGKLVGKFKEEARKTLLECHQAVPVWIMPLAAALESFELGTIDFDVVLIDEASQCDVLGLAALVFFVRGLLAARELRHLEAREAEALRRKEEKAATKAERRARKKGGKKRRGG
jgi:hypothetical protein